MKVVVAVDSFKGSMTSMEAGLAVKAGILAAHKDAQVVVKPLADGGEGTTDALIEGMGGERIDLTVTGPYHEPLHAYYGYLKESNTAVMEMASAAGITISNRKDPMEATTYGVGEMILDAIHRDIRNFIIGIGGSATNDGGIGMLEALGFTFLDKNGQDVGEGGQALAKVTSVKVSDKAELLSQCNFQIACDVTNPLCGFQGATYIYGPQKGVTSEMLPGCRYGKLCQSYCCIYRAGSYERCRSRCCRWYGLCIFKLSERRTDARDRPDPGCGSSGRRNKKCRYCCYRRRSSGSSDCHGQNSCRCCQTGQKIRSQNRCFRRKRYQRGSCLQ